MRIILFTFCLVLVSSSVVANSTDSVHHHIVEYLINEFDEYNGRSFYTIENLQILGLGDIDKPMFSVKVKFDVVFKRDLRDFVEELRLSHGSFKAMLIKAKFRAPDTSRLNWLARYSGPERQDPLFAAIL